MDAPCKLFRTGWIAKFSKSACLQSKVVSEIETDGIARANRIRAGGRKLKSEPRTRPVLVELRESVKALAAENERLEGTALAAQNHAAEYEQAKLRAETELSQFKTHVEGELKQARTAHAEASTQAAGALQNLAEARAVHAAQVAALQADLTAAVRKAHELELNLVRAEALLEAKGIQPATAESRKPKDSKEASDQRSD